MKSIFRNIQVSFGFFLFQKSALWLSIWILWFKLQTSKAQWFKNLKQRTSAKEIHGGLDHGFSTMLQKSVVLPWMWRQDFGKLHQKFRERVCHACWRWMQFFYSWASTLEFLWITDLVAMTQIWKRQYFHLMLQKFLRRVRKNIRFFTWKSKKTKKYFDQRFKRFPSNYHKSSYFINPEYLLSRSNSLAYFFFSPT